MTKTKPKGKTSLEVKKSDLEISNDHDIAREELSGHKDNESLNVSETDEDENEGTGSGNIERSDEDPFKGK
jgi:hypothetical protein